MPDSASMPAHPSATARATRASHGSPAATVTQAPPQVSASTATPAGAHERRRCRRQPSSADDEVAAAGRRRSAGVPAASASRTAATRVGLVVGHHDVARRAADAQRRQVGEPRRHAPSLCTAASARRRRQDGDRTGGRTYRCTGWATTRRRGRSTATLWREVNAQFTDGAADARLGRRTRSAGGCSRRRSPSSACSASCDGLDVLDLACGTGYFSAWMARRGPGWSRWTCRPSSSRTARRCQAAYGPVFPLLLADAAQVPLAGPAGSTSW